MFWVFVFICIAIICVGNLIVNFSLQTALDLLLVFAVMLVPSALSLLLSKILPAKFFDASQKFYLQKKDENKFLQFLNVKKWKDKIPNWGNVGGDLNSQRTLDESGVQNFIFQTCQGEIVHWFCIVSSLISAIILTIGRNDLFFRMILPIFIVYFIVNMLSILVQRYNRPRLQVLLKRVQRQQANLTKNQDNEDEDDENKQPV